MGSTEVLTFLFFFFLVVGSSIGSLGGVIFLKYTLDRHHIFFADEDQKKESKK